MDSLCMELIPRYQQADVTHTDGVCKTYSIDTCKVRAEYTLVNIDGNGVYTLYARDNYFVNATKEVYEALLSRGLACESNLEQGSFFARRQL